MSWLKKRKKIGLKVNYLNLHAFNLATISEKFRRAINRCDILFCDGSGIKFTARILNIRIGHRMTPPDWVDSLFSEDTKNNCSFYFTGDEPDVIELFVKRIKTRHSKIKIEGFHHGFFLNTKELEKDLLEDLATKKPDIVLTWYGNAQTRDLGT